MEPLSRTYSPTLMPASPLSHNNYAFERDFVRRYTGLVLPLLTLCQKCTNFTCCGQSLADLHLLVDHFEEAHVLVLDADGRPTYPSPAAFYRPIADDYRDYCPDSYPPSPSISNTTSSDTSDSPCSTSFVFDYPHASSEDRDPIRYGCENSGLFGPSVDEEVLTLSTVEFDFDSRKSQLWESLDDDNNILLDYTSCGTYSDVDGVHEADDDTRLPVQEDFRQVCLCLSPEQRHLIVAHRDTISRKRFFQQLQSQLLLRRRRCH